MNIYPKPTPLLKAEQLGRYLGCPGLLLKLESDNPSGTHKDRAAAAIIDQVRSRSFSSLTVGSCGSYGVALARLAKHHGLQCRVYVPKQYRGSRTKELSGYSAEVIHVAGTYEDAVQASQIDAVASQSFDANPLGKVGDIVINAYSEISTEIIKAIGMIPSSIWVPVGNGTTLAGIFKGFSVLKNGLPCVGGVGSYNCTAAIESAIRGCVIELNPKDLIETALNEPLASWKSFHAREVIDAVRLSNGFACAAKDTELSSAQGLLQQFEKINCRPASAAGLIGFMQHFKALPPDGLHVIVITG